ncbi:chemotaxis protein CheB [Halopseudomonas sp. SMJS2]|uniref:chemotaxis protein CheB n=1 Tax=Halopseudomonas sp. SMJS2 TaxID=3041098 RepID=UPI00245289B9|nr:chemotaxis protein CheB [Halopseudomonas sp. SMJS2]WGK61845.1 chemotaxis protein CheB [Halopseudomonas sp. SMJS2]
MTDVQAPTIALLVSSERGRRTLGQAVQGFGYQLVFDAAPERVQLSELTEVVADLWLLDMPDESALADWLLESSPVPVLLGSGEIPPPEHEDHVRWQRRLLQKLSALLGDAPQAPPVRLVPAPLPISRRCVWLLGASLGGPAAVKQFLDVLPAQAPVAFVYAQHIDAGFESQLPHILGRQNAWRIRNCTEGSQLQHGEVLVAPIGRMLHFGAEGQVQLQEQPWPGAYQPAIETLLDELARTFAPHCGAIIFSGMGEDGVAACGRLRRQGMEVWTQSATSAACSTMPQAVRTAGYSSRDGSPDELAAALQQWLEQERAADA